MKVVNPFERAVSYFGTCCFFSMKQKEGTTLEEEDILFFHNSIKVLMIIPLEPLSEELIKKWGVKVVDGMYFVDTYTQSKTKVNKGKIATSVCNKYGKGGISIKEGVVVYSRVLERTQKIARVSGGNTFDTEGYLVSVASSIVLDIKENKE